MINKKYATRLLVTTLCVSTVLCTSGINNQAAVVKDQVSVQAKNSIIETSSNGTTTISDTTNTDTSRNQKDETVYVKADATGNISEVIVSDWLKNYQNDKELKDKTTLTDIVNVKGDETYTIDEDGNLVWSTDGGDIYYQGKTDKEIPIGIKVSYTLDGKEITPDELEGKSGKLTVKLEFENKSVVSGSESKEEMYTPFSIISALTVSTDKYDNVEVTNGKIVSDGDKLVIVGVSLPGLKESLDLSEDIDAPDYVELTADVTEYEPLTILNVATAGLLSNIELDDSEQIKELSDALEDLEDASEQLVDGSSDLSDGLNELAEKTGEYTDGVTDLVDGVSSYTDGVSQVTNGIGSLYEGVTKLEDGASSLESGAGKLESGAKELSSGASTLTTGLSDAKSGMNKIVSNFNQLVQGATSMSDGLSKYKTALSTLSSGKKSENAVYEKLSETVANNEAIIAALEASGADETIISQLKANTEGQKKIVEGLTSSGAQISAGLEQLSSSTDTLVSGSKTLEGGLEKVAEANQSMETALGKLYTGSNTLKTGINSLKTGATTLKSGTTELKTGMASLKTGVKTLMEGTDKLDAATLALTSGGDKLTSASKSLKEGVQTAADGGETLKNGMYDFNQDGIKKLTGTFNDKFQGIFDKADDLIDAAKDYNTFTDISEDVDGNVQFIIEIH